jgi:hypothetical protein
MLTTRSKVEGAIGFAYILFVAIVILITSCPVVLLYFAFAWYRRRRGRIDGDGTEMQPYVVVLRRGVPITRMNRREVQARDGEEGTRLV